MTIHLSPDVVTATVAVVGLIVGIVGGLLKLLLRPLEQKLSTIAREVLPNGGKSLADRMERIEVVTEEHGKDIAEIRGRLA